MSRRSSRYEAKKGRSSSERFTRLTHKLMSSNAYRALSPNARSLLLELAMMENGRNNGIGLFLSVRDAAARMGVSDPNTAGKAFDELEALGFIALTVDAHFAVKAGAGSRARFWRLTWEAVDGKMAPTHDYQSREPAPKTSARRRMAAGLNALKRWCRRAEAKIPVQDFHTRAVDRVENIHTVPDASSHQSTNGVRDFPTHFVNNGGNTEFLVVGNSHTYTADQSVGVHQEPKKGGPAWPR